MHRQCSHFFYSPLFILEDKPLHTLMTKNTYILLFNTPTHLCLYHNINPLHTLMTRVKARHFTASTDNLAQRLSIYIYIYGQEAIKSDCKGFTQRNYATPAKPDSQGNKQSQKVFLLFSSKRLLNNPFFHISW